MILVDTSVWIDFLNVGSPELAEALEASLVATHPMVIGEIALGSIREREKVLSLLTRLPQVAVARHREVMALVEAHELYGLGLALVDVHLLASARLTPHTSIWSRDQRLMRAAVKLKVAP